MYPRDTRPLALSCGRIDTAWLIGTANPMLLGSRTDCGVDADDFAARVDQRAAAVAEVDGRVGLDIVVQARVAQFAADETDDPDGHRVDVAERVADGAHPFADPQFVGVAERHGRQVVPPGNPQQRDVDSRIGAHHLGTKRSAIGERDGDAFSRSDDVMVGKNVAVTVDEETAAGATRTVKVAWIGVGAEELLAAPERGSLAGRVDVDHRGVHPLRNVGKVRGPISESDRCRCTGRPRRGLRRRGDNRRTELPGQQQANQKSHGGGQSDSQNRETAHINR